MSMYSCVWAQWDCFLAVCYEKKNRIFAHFDRIMSVRESKQMITTMYRVCVAEQDQRNEQKMNNTNINTQKLISAVDEHWTSPP